MQVIGMEPVPPELYDTYWSMLREALDTLLTQSPGTFKPISYEQMYSAVYKCVCRQHAERLHFDLLNHLKARLLAWRSALHALDSGPAADLEFVSEFNRVLGQYFLAVGNIVPIFTYLNRLYVEPKLQTSINSEMLTLFTKTISDQAMPRIMDILSRVHQTPFALSPAVMQSLLQNIYSLNSKYANLNPPLFAKYLTGIGAPMAEEDLEAQREADRRLQEDLRMNGFGGGDQSRKRELSDVNDHSQHPPPPSLKWT